MLSIEWSCIHLECLYKVAVVPLFIRHQIISSSQQSNFKHPQRQHSINTLQNHTQPSKCTHKTFSSLSSPPPAPLQHQLQQASRNATTTAQSAQRPALSSMTPASQEQDPASQSAPSTTPTASGTPHTRAVNSSHPPPAISTALNRQPMLHVPMSATKHTMLALLIQMATPPSAPPTGLLASTTTHTPNLLV